MACSIESQGNVNRQTFCLGCPALNHVMQWMNAGIMRRRFMCACGCACGRRAACVLAVVVVCVGGETCDICTFI